jgi:hypothetical protein
MTSINKKSIDVNSRDLHYYETINKVFWHILNDMGPFKQNEKIPCILVENDSGTLKILDLDHDIEEDEFTYTVFRRFVGETYNARIDVLLIKNNTMYNLKGDIVDFNTLSRSNILVDKTYLSKTGYAEVK